MGKKIVGGNLLIIQPMLGNSWLWLVMCTRLYLQCSILVRCRAPVPLTWFFLEEVLNRNHPLISRTEILFAISFALNNTFTRDTNEEHVLFCLSRKHLTQLLLERNTCSKNSNPKGLCLCFALHTSVGLCKSSFPWWFLLFLVKGSDVIHIGIVS